MARYPGFKSPSWQELDPKKHLDLIWRLLMYRGRADQYFRRGAAANAAPIPDTPATRRAARDFVARDGKLRVWHARLFEFYGDTHYPAPPGEQTIVELRQSLSRDSKNPSTCLEDPKSWSPSTYIVTSDLKGPDPKVDAGTAARLANSQLVIYDGTTYLVTGTSAVARLQSSVKRPDAWPLTYCSFRIKS